MQQKSAERRFWGLKGSLRAMNGAVCRAVNTPKDHLIRQPQIC